MKANLHGLDALFGSIAWPAILVVPWIDLFRNQNRYQGVNNHIAQQPDQKPMRYSIS
jgi:hypothetical protein